MINNRMMLGALAAATLSLAAFAPAANAQFIPVIENAGQTQLNDNTFPTGAINTTPGATNVFIAELFSTFDSGLVNGEQIVGTLSSRVFRNTNGLLDFFYQVNITNSVGNAGVTATNLSDFSAFTTEAAFDNDTDIDGAGPFTAGGRRPFGSQRASGGLVAFAFNTNLRTAGNDQGPGDGTLETGTSSSVLGVRTNATGFRVSNGTVNAGAAANAAILAPAVVAVVPEAGTFALLLPAIALGAVVIRRKK